MNVQHFQVPHGKIAYAWSHGPCNRPLVVLHGMGDSAIHTYAPLFATTALCNTPTLFIDLPGFGEGKADTPYPATLELMSENVAELLAHLEIRSAPVFAHSMGANVALLLANDHPSLVTPLILAEPLLDRNHSVLAAQIARFTEDAFIERGYTMLTRATTLQAYRRDTAASAFLSTISLANPRIMHRAATSLLQPRNPDFIQLLHANNQHTVLIVGGNTPMGQTDVQIPGLQVVAIPNAGHYMFAEQPAAIACAILKLVDGKHYGGY